MTVLTIIATCLLALIACFGTLFVGAFAVVWAVWLWQRIRQGKGEIR